jgi:hypothetical protein
MQFIRKIPCSNINRNNHCNAKQPRPSPVARSITPQSICSTVFPQQQQCCAGFSRRHRRQRPTLSGCRVCCRLLRSCGESGLLLRALKTHVWRRAGRGRRGASRGCGGLRVLKTHVWRRTGRGRREAGLGCGGLRVVCDSDKVSNGSAREFKWEM